MGEVVDGGEGFKGTVEEAGQWSAGGLPDAGDEFLAVTERNVTTVEIIQNGPNDGSMVVMVALRGLELKWMTLTDPDPATHTHAVVYCSFTPEMLKVLMGSLVTAIVHCEQAQGHL